PPPCASFFLSRASAVSSPVYPQAPRTGSPPNPPRGGGGGGRSPPRPPRLAPPLSPPSPKSPPPRRSFLVTWAVAKRRLGPTSSAMISTTLRRLPSRSS